MTRQSFNQLVNSTFDDDQVCRLPFLANFYFKGTLARSVSLVRYIDSILISFDMIFLLLFFFGGSLALENERNCEEASPPLKLPECTVCQLFVNSASSMFDKI
jgi:hypothetical protein